MIAADEADAPAFPFSGSIAYLGETGAKVKIIRRDADGHAMIQRIEGVTRAHGASRNRREPLANLYASRDDAIRFKADGKRKPTRRRKAA